MPGSSAVTVSSSRQLAGGKPQANTFLTTGLLVPTGILYDTELVPLAATAALVRTKASGDELVSCSRTRLMPPVVHADAACRLSNYCLAAVHLDVVPALLMQFVEQLFPALLRCQPQQDFLDENAELFRCVCVCVYVCGVHVSVTLAALVFNASAVEAFWALCRSAANPSRATCFLCCRQLEAYDSDRHCADVEARDGDGPKARRAAAKRKVKGGVVHKRAAPRRTKEPPARRAAKAKANPAGAAATRPRCG